MGFRSACEFIAIHEAITGEIMSHHRLRNTEGLTCTLSLNMSMLGIVGTRFLKQERFTLEHYHPTCVGFLR